MRTIDPEGLALDWVWSDYVVPELTRILDRPMTPDELHRANNQFLDAAHENTQRSIDIMSGTNPRPTAWVIGLLVDDIVARANPIKRANPRDEPGWTEATGNSVRT